ncbi:hypothetical protein Tco_0781068 [Tanacetum coccineum]
MTEHKTAVTSDGSGRPYEEVTLSWFDILEVCAGDNRYISFFEFGFHYCGTRLITNSMRLEAEGCLRDLRHQAEQQQFSGPQGPAKGPAQPDAPEEVGLVRDMNELPVEINLTQNVSNDQPLNLKGTEGVVGSNLNVCERISSLMPLRIEGEGTDLTSIHIKINAFRNCLCLCGMKIPEESNKIEKYVGGHPDMIHGSVVASKPKTRQDAVEIITELMDKKIHTFVERQIESKRKFEDTSRNTQNQ